MCFLCFCQLLCDCKVFTLCVSDTVPQRTFSLRIPLFKNTPQEGSSPQSLPTVPSGQQSLPTTSWGQQSLLTASGGQQGPPTVPSGRWSQPTADGGQQNLPPPSGGQQGLHTPKSESDVYTTGFYGLTCEEIDEMLEVLQQQLPPQQQSVDSILDADLQQVLGMDVKDFML